MNRIMPLVVIVAAAAAAPDFSRAAAGKAAADKAAPPARSAGTGARKPPSACAGCGVVLSVSVAQHGGGGAASGLAGRAPGAALPNDQIDTGNGRPRTVAVGAAAGAMKWRPTHVWFVKVRLDNNEEATFQFGRDPGFSRG